MGLAGILYNCSPPSASHAQTAVSANAKNIAYPAGSPSKEIKDAAEAFILSLSKPQSRLAVFSFADSERTNWHFFPKTRNGLPLDKMDADQKEKAMALLRASLSDKGFENAGDIMALESVLRELEGRGDDDEWRNPERYYLAVFGDPNSGKPWGWRMEGHHLSLNYTAASEKRVANVPSFWGANPGKVPSGSQQGLRILAIEEDLGRKLVKSLSPTQFEYALIAKKAPNEMVTFVDQKVSLETYEGIAFEKLSPDQQSMLKSLTSHYLGKWNTQLAPDHLHIIDEAGWENVFFGWAGGVEPGEPHYYRIHGPRLLIEYDNVQDGANHIHTVVRDPENDFGEDLLRQHLKHDH